MGTNTFAMLGVSSDLREDGQTRKLLPYGINSAHPRNLLCRPGFSTKFSFQNLESAYQGICLNPPLTQISVFKGGVLPYDKSRASNKVLRITLSSCPKKYNCTFYNTDFGAGTSRLFSWKLQTMNFSKCIVLYRAKITASWTSIDSKMRMVTFPPEIYLDISGFP